MKIFVNENTDDLIKDIRRYVKNTNKSQTNIDTLDLCHILGKIEYLEEKKRRLEINVLVNDKEIERLNNELELQNIEMGREIERLKDMINKAIEYINSDEMLKLREEFEYCNDKDLFDEFAGHLDRILRGSDKE